MAEETRQMKPFSQESYNVNDDTAKKVTSRVFKQVGIELKENNPQGSPFAVDMVGQFQSRTIYVECARTSNPMWNDSKFPDKWNGVHVPARKEHVLNADKWPKDLSVKQKDIFYSLVNKYLSFVAVCFDTSAILNSPQINVTNKDPRFVNSKPYDDPYYVVPVKHWKIKSNPQPNIQAPTNEI